MRLNHDINRIGAVIASVNELVKLKLLQEFTEVPVFYVFPTCLDLNSEKYMKNWCQNILRVWSLTYASKILDDESKIKVGEVFSIEMVLFSKDTGDFLCRYSEKNGLSYY